MLPFLFDGGDLKEMATSETICNWLSVAVKQMSVQFLVRRKCCSGFTFGKFNEGFATITINVYVWEVTSAYEAAP